MKYEIEIEGLPEGWKPVAFRRPENGEKFFYCGEICSALNQLEDYIVVEKIQPRRIVLDLTQHEYSLLLKIPIEQRLFDDPVMFDLLRKIQTAEVKETDIPLTNDEPKLSLSIEDSIKWAEHLILQLDEYHQGRNSWLCHYGKSKQAEEARKTSIFDYVVCDGRFNISKRKKGK